LRHDYAEDAAPLISFLPLIIYYYVLSPPRLLLFYGRYAAKDAMMPP